MAQILVVDDSASMRSMVAATLQSAGHMIQDADNGEAALNKAKSSNFDVIITDLNMPVMSGQEVLEEMLNDEELRHLPVIILTTSSAQSDVLALSRLRCSAYVVKPVDYNEFQTTVKSIVDFWFKVAALPTRA